MNRQVATFVRLLCVCVLFVPASLILRPDSAQAQAYRDFHATYLTVAGDTGKDPVHTATIDAPILGSSYRLFLPGSNATGLLLNDGSGNLSWSTNFLPLMGGTLSTSTSSPLLSLSSTVSAPATVLTMNGGRIILQSTVSNISSGSTIPANVAAVVVGDNSVTNSPATATLPAGTEGQVLYITTQDPDGVTITTTVNSVSVTVTIDDSEVGTFMYLGGQWRLQH